MPCYQLLRQGHPRLRGPLVVEVQDIEDLLSHMALPWPKGLLRQAVGGGLNQLNRIPGFWKVFKLKICIGIHNASHQDQHDEDVEVDPP